MANWGIAVGGLLLLAAAAPRFAGIAAAVALGLYLLGLGIGGAGRRDRSGAMPELCFALGVTLCLALVVAYRLPVAIPFTELVRNAGLPHSLDPFDAAPFAVPGLVATLGLSVFAWHAASYVIDLYRGDAAAARNPSQTFAYLFFVPCLLAGPTLRYRELHAPLATRQPSMASAAYGVRRVTLGIAKVWLIGRTLAVPAEAAFTAAPGELGALLAWTGLVCFALQVYYDLSGVADIALGLGRMLGFRLPENFDWPYSADSLDRFWRRWNTTLTAWTDAYLRVPPVVAFVALAAWYGATPTLLAWGALQGALVTLERTRWCSTRLARLRPWVRHALVVGTVTFSWILFRAETFVDAGFYIAALAGFGSPPLPGTPSPLTVWTATMLMVGTVGAVPLLRVISRWSVTLDAMATAFQMIVTAGAMFVWTRLGGRKRQPPS